MVLIRHQPRKIWLSWIAVFILSAIVLKLIFPTSTSADDGSTVNPVFFDLSQIKEKGKVVVLVEYGPTTYFIHKDQPAGFYYDFFTEWARHEGIEAEFVPVNNQREIFTRLNNGLGDIIAGYSFMDNRQGVAYTNALWRSKLMLIQRNDNSKVNNIQELQGKGIWVESNTNHRDWLLAGLSKVGITSFIHQVPDTTTLDMMAAYIEEGKFDYLVTNPQEAERIAKEFKGLETGIALGPTLEVALAVRNNAPGLLTSLNNFIQSTEEDKKLAAWLTKYQATPVANNSPGFEICHKKNRLSPFDNLIREYAATINWDWLLLASLIKQESSFNPNAVGPGGSSGLMQLMPATAKRFGADDNIFDPLTNVRSGVAYIKVLKKMWSHIPDPEQRAKFILASYNIGEAHVLDAVRLAKKYDADPLIWDGNVETFLAKKTDKEFYTDPVVKYGYCNGRHACNYVQSVYNRYMKYKGML